MKRLLLVGILFIGFATSSFAESRQEVTTKVNAALEILDRYHNELTDEEANPRVLHLVYWTPSDRDPAPQYQERLTRVMRHIQKFYADEMQQLGFGPRTIGMQDDKDGQLKIHLVKGAGPFADYNKQSGDRVRDECRPVLRAAKIDPRQETILIFCNMGQWDEKTRVMSHQSPYYAGGTNVSGTAWQLDEPIMDTKNLRDRKPMQDGEYGRISMGKHNSIFIGGVAHELGHALSLPHNKERPDEFAEFGTALMGSGNRTYAAEQRGEGKGSFLTLAHAMRLASHPQFNGSTRGMSEKVSSNFDRMEFTEIEGGFRASGVVSSSMPVYAVLAYTDPEGGGDYNATTQVAVPNHDGSFSIDCTALVSGKSGELRLVACHVNGKTTQRGFGYGIGRGGVVDLSGIHLRLALAPIVEALNKNDEASARDLAGKLPPAVVGVARRVIDAKRDRSELPRPDSIELKRTEMPMSDSMSTESDVGWLQPTYDRLPDSAMLLSSGGKVFEHGIYAHAPARHVYALGGRWQSVAGTAGMADGHSGSVVFVIRCDGRETWRSKLIRRGKPESFKLDVSDVGELELVVEDGGDGNGADWGVWLEPTLLR